MKNKLKIITLFTLGTLSTTVFAQSSNQPTSQTGVIATTGTKIEIPSSQVTVNDYSNIGEGNAYEKAITPLLREISRKKSILELKKLDKEIAKLDEVEKKETNNSGFVPIPNPQPAQTMKTNSTNTVDETDSVNAVKVLMTFGSEDDLYAKIAVGNQGGYTVRKGDILPDGRTVVAVNSNYIEVSKDSVAKKSNKTKTEKIFLTAITPTNTNREGVNNGLLLPGSMGTNTNNITYTPIPETSSTMPTLMPIPAVNTARTTNVVQLK
jgi:type IV pilus biogenesis protein PilP